MPKIFCCYRREDSTHQTGRIFDQLVHRFGKDDLFRDVDSMPLGLDFRRVLSEHVAQCDVLLAIIGDGWLSANEKSGERRLDNPNDFVRIEIESALRREIPVIPVLVGQAPMPKADDLPECLRELAFRKALAIRADPDFHHDVERLIHGINDVLKQPRSPSTVLEPNDKKPGTPHDGCHPRPPEPPKRIFISHSSEDREFVEREIIEPLRRHGIQTWYSTDDIDPSTPWRKEIEKGLESCDWFVVAISNHSLASRWVESEVDWAMDERSTRFVPILIEECEWKGLHLMVRKYQCADFRRNLDEARRRLLKLWGIVYRPQPR